VKEEDVDVVSEEAEVVIAVVNAVVAAVVPQPKLPNDSEMLSHLGVCHNLIRDSYFYAGSRLSYVS
jgi:hypothetical protein